jgi:hypothetical protein
MEKKPKIWADGLIVKAALRNGKSVLNLSFNAAKFSEFLKKNTNERGYVNVDCWEKDTPGKFGDTHSASLNDWQPKASSKAPAAEAQYDDPDMPF